MFIYVLNTSGWRTLKLIKSSIIILKITRQNIKHTEWQNAQFLTATEDTTFHYQIYFKCCFAQQTGRSKVLFPRVLVGISARLNPPGSAIFLGSAQLLTEMNTRNIFQGSNGGRCLGLTIFPLLCVVCLQIL